jgi:hypothetical protein
MSAIAEEVSPRFRIRLIRLTSSVGIVPGLPTVTPCDRFTARASRVRWPMNSRSDSATQARVQLTDGTRQVVAHAANGRERARLWDRWRSLDKNLDGYARRRSRTAVLVLEPRTEPV